MQGFTLVELLVVVAIITVLAAIALPSFSKYKLRTYKTTLDADAKNIYTAAQMSLTVNPLATVNSLSMLQTGGYHNSPDVTFDDGSLSLVSGNIEIHSAALKTQGLDNNAVIFFNGRIESAASP